MDLSFLLSISSHSLRHSLPRLGACWLWPLGFSPMILLNSWELKTDLEEIVETLFFWESQPTYLKEGKPVVWIRKKIRSWILFSSSDMTQSWTLRTQRLSYQHRSVLCLSQKSQKRNFVRWSIYETSIHSKLQDRFQGHYYFSICVQSVKVYTVASSGPGTQFSESFKNASTFFFFSEWKVLNYRLQVHLQSCSGSGKVIDIIHFCEDSTKLYAKNPWHFVR